MIKDKWYWPGIKENIRSIISKCETCQVNNRKKMGGSEFICTTRVFEEVALDMIDMRSEGKYVLVAIDYFTRSAVTKVLESKESKGVVEQVESWIDAGIKTEEIITDNGKEFVSAEFRAM